MTTLRYILLAVALVLVTLLATLAVEKNLFAHPAPVCVAAQNELCPGDAFVASFDRWKDLQSEIQKKSDSSAIREFQQMNDEWTGIKDRLAQSIPPGYQFNDKTMRFVKVTPPVPASQPSK